MDLEIVQLDLRYEGLRRRSPRKERRLLASLAEVGQQVPIVVVPGDVAAAGPVVIDGYKRVRALRQLTHDLVAATSWDLDHAGALLLERLMRTAESESAMEQGWLLMELRDRFELRPEELARRFDKSPSWVSRRLALVGHLPEPIQQHVRAGAIVAHAAMKYLVPLARANRAASLRLAAAIAPHPLSSRQVAELYAAYVSGSEATRELVLGNPIVFLRAKEEARRAANVEPPPLQQLVADLGVIGAVARRAEGRLARGLGTPLSTEDKSAARRGMDRAQADVEALSRRCGKELNDAGPEHTDGDSRIA